MPTEGEKSPEAENNNNNNKKGKTGGSQVKHTHTHTSREVPKLLAFKMKCSSNSVSCSGHLSLGWMKRSSLGAIFLLPGHVFWSCFTAIRCFPCNRGLFLFLICP